VLVNPCLFVSFLLVILFSVGHSIFCWSFYFLLVILFSVGHSILCWSFYFLLVILFSVLRFAASA
jgi:hypothetical protein